MKEEKIIIVIGEDGSISLETKGITGPICEEKLEEIMSGLEQNVISKKKTDEYYQEDKTISRTTIKRG
ncbi:DUF2997 domain-containing protein [bacterium]|nr:DUF2997 domain-containing protein [bacterium]